jgi:hypothetical protein
MRYITAHAASIKRTDVLDKGEVNDVRTNFSVCCAYNPLAITKDTESFFLDAFTKLKYGY